MHKNADLRKRRIRDLNPTGTIFYNMLWDVHLSKWNEGDLEQTHPLTRIHIGETLRYPYRENLDDIWRRYYSIID